MQDEYIDIVTKTGEPTGYSALKSEVHSKGLYHNTVHIWFYTPQGEILLQQRAKTKRIKPLLWDVSVAGHIDAGETILDGAVREIKEEIGLKVEASDLHKIGVFDCFKTYPNGVIDNEFHHTFISELKEDFNALVPQKEEVEALKLVTFEDFKHKLKHSATNGHFVASNKPLYEFVLKSIKSIL